jgi:arylsulfatase A-like enzyme
MLVSRRNLLLGGLALPALAARKSAPEKPNIVLIVVDRLPGWILGAYGNKEVKTPNIDRLAQTGTKFLNHFTPAPETKLGATVLITGRTPMQLGAGAQITSADVTLDKVLAGAGYAFHFTGAQANGQPLPGGDVTTSAQKFIDQQSAGKPFFLMAAFGDLRPPYEGIPQKYLAMYAGQRFEDYSVEAAAPNSAEGKEMLANRVANLRKVAAAVSAVDDNVQGIIARISQKQMVDNTLVIFTSTCGSLYGRHGLWDSGDASDPPNMFDEVVKTPMFWSWPGRVPAQATQVEMVSAYDLLPSLCDMVDAEIPGRNLCGRSYKLLATGKRLPKKQTWRTTVFGHYGNTEMARVERYKLIQRNDGKGPNELYDMVADAGERTNQIDNEQFVSVKNTLAGELADWKKRYSG